MIGLETTEGANPWGSCGDEIPLPGLRRVIAACDRFEGEWRSGRRPAIESFLVDAEGPEREALLSCLLALEVGLRRDQGERPSEAEYVARFPDEQALVRSVLAGPAPGETAVRPDVSATEWLSVLRAPDRPPGPATTEPSAAGFVSGTTDLGFGEDPASGTTVARTQAGDGGGTEPTPSWPRPPRLPVRIGRFGVRRLLGEGGFGRVYQAWDDELGRDVALKVPRAGAFANEQKAEEFLREARLAASLKHPAIVTVHDVGRAGDGTPFVVLEYVEGQPLSDLLRAEAFGFRRLAGLTAEVAEALHYAHERGLVHRDLKPANLLIDTQGRPHVADFGLAVHEAVLRSRSWEVAGTPHYMAPEQVRGESHRLDGRTDLWGLGVVLYLMLTRRLPFVGTRAEVFDAILHREPRPPRQVVPGIPRELERVCLKCLSKRMTDRHANARELAADLHVWLADAAPGDSPGGAGAAAAEGETVSWRSSVRVIPKGLRSFDAADTGFFLALLPGPYDREGLPAGVRFWKTRMEALDPEDGFTVGLLYGPSGCGKSSLVKAGLIPNLSGHVRPVYVEAAPDDTDLRLLRALRRACPGLPEGLTLADAVLTLREAPALRRGRKLVVVIDQFEQWLHAPRDGRVERLVEALRQCDGAAVACLLMVRDDFGMAAMRFMNALEVPVVEGKNYATVDRFDVPHAASVLELFGRALGRLPLDGPLTTDQRRFLDQAAAGMAEDGKVAPVRLALFAEMSRGEPWNPASLRRVGGAEGLGVAFLESALGSSATNPRHRMHAQAARAVLKALLPDPGVNMRGHLRSDRELLAASGYAGRPAAFDDLIAILDGDLRLITPCDPERSGSAESNAPCEAEAPGRWFQLTHDYLVSSLRRWLAGKQKETLRGRAELLLEGRAAVWSARPDRRYLPTCAEWGLVGLMTRWSAWADGERRMMAAATRYYAARLVVAAAMAGSGAAASYAVAGWYEQRQRARESESLVKRLLVAEFDHVRETVAQLDPYWPSWRAPIARAADDPGRSVGIRTRAHIALVGRDGGSVPFLVERMLSADPPEHAVIGQAVSARKYEAVARLWRAASPSRRADGRLLRAAAGLAAWAPDDARWEGAAGNVARALVAEPSPFVAAWVDALRPVGPRLAGPLAEVYENPRRRGAERLNAAVALRALEGDETGLPRLVGLLTEESDPGDFRVLVSRLAAEADAVLPTLRAVEPADADAGVGADERLRVARRRANTAVARLRLGEPDKAWPLLRASSDPTVRDLLVHRLVAFGVDPTTLLERFAAETDPGARQALLLALGEPASVVEPEARDPGAVGTVERVFANDPDPGVHAAAEWLLRLWAGPKRVARAREGLTGTTREGWSVNRQGQTMVHVRGPVAFTMGSSSPLSTHHEAEHAVRIDRSFALSAQEVTVDEFLRYNPDLDFDRDVYAGDVGPITKVSWYEAVRYCRWLSEQEGVAEGQMCYPEVEAIGPGMRLPDDLLDRTGYRLPTEAEWEYAARAGTSTPYFFGENPRSLRSYGWFSDNSDFRVWPGGLLKPNPLGLFDVYGNVREWCHDSFVPAPNDPNAEKPADAVRVSRGGGYRASPLGARSALRERHRPETRYSDFGLRVARTLPK